MSIPIIFFFNIVSLKFILRIAFSISRGKLLTFDIDHISRHHFE